jgi:hypothetical protein
MGPEITVSKLRAADRAWVLAKMDFSVNVH